MFEFLFRYPIPAYTKGHFVLLGAWPGWLLAVLIVICSAALAFLIRTKMPEALPAVRNWRVWVIWGMQSALVAMLLLMLWQPALRVAEMKSNQNIVAVVVDDSQSMSIADSNGSTREAAALAALRNGVLAGLQERFQTRIYRLGGGLTQVEGLDGMTPTDTATHLNEGLKQLVAQTSDLPIGAVVLLSDGSENNAGVSEARIGADSLQALHSRSIPVHAIGFGEVQRTHDIELEDVNVSPSTVVNARLTAAVSFTQHGYAGGKATLRVRDGEKLLAAREVTLRPNGVIQTETLSFSAGEAGARSLKFSIDPLSGEETLANNSLTHPVFVSNVKRKVLYIEGEPRWEFKFIRRAEDDDPTVQVVSMLRTSENKIYRQGISDPNELANGFPTRAEDLFSYSGIIIGSVSADYLRRCSRSCARVC